ncbi:hypothetical protein KEM56_006111 [Ascosphaera pollenicola]|nr:hypothetical protein KEM56_006111 [Ascosphaera pollenicola]
MDRPQDESTKTKDSDDATLKHRLLGPSLTKAGQTSVDQQKDQVSEIIYEASKGSKFFHYEQLRDKALTEKIERLLVRKQALEKKDLTPHIKHADAYLAELESTRNLSQVIVHVDCDAFFAAVEELDRPELREVPMAVGKGVLTTCNYHARRFGVRSGMAGFIAMKLCPELTLISPNYHKYSAKANEIRLVFERYDPDYQSASVDEAYLNMTPYLREHPDLTPEEAVQQMRDEIFKETHVTVSAGIAPNSRIAKIASNWNKPNGQFRVVNDRDAVMEFMSTIPVRKVNGVGRVWERELESVGIKTCADIYTQRGLIAPLFGQNAFEFLMEVHLSLGRTSLVSEEASERKSIGCEHTFRDIANMDELVRRLRLTAEQLAEDLAEKDLRGRTLVLKVKLHTYEVLSRQTVPPSAVFTADEIYKHALPMLQKLKKEIPKMTLRLMGLRCTNLVPNEDYENPIMTKFLARGRAPASSMTAAEQEMEESQNKADEELDKDIRESLSQLDVPDPCTDEIEVPASGEPGPLQTTVDTTEVIPCTPPKPQTYTCPICGSEGPADDALLNEHIDFCLSRDAIKDAVESTVDSQAPSSSVPNTSSFGKSQSKEREKKRKQEDDDKKPKKKLFFA